MIYLLINTDLGPYIIIGLETVFTQAGFHLSPIFLNLYLNLSHFHIRFTPHIVGI